MSRILHAFDIIEEKCNARMACMKVCPTQAIRVRDGKARVKATMCIDCGECIVACPSGAIKPKTDPLEAIRRFKYKVAIPSPTLFGQFPLDITPSDIFDGLLALGFDAVYDTSMESELVNLAIRDYLDEYPGPFPLISSACPVIVRLIQVLFPDMSAQIIPIESPRELSAREMKKLYTKALGMTPEEIGAVYITPCPSKVVAIKQPAEEVESFLDLGVSIADLYNPLFAAITKLKKNQRPQGPNHVEPSPIMSTISLAWAFRGGQCQSLKPSRYLSVSQLPNNIKLFNDIEKGKIRGIEFIEAYACTGGCIAGPLTVDDMFLSRAKIQKLIEQMGPSPQSLTDEVRRRYLKGDYYLRQPVRPRVMETGAISFEEKVNRIKNKEEIVKVLPGLDCGLCGAPTCSTFADDVACGQAEKDDCVLLSEKRLKKLRETYGTKMW